MPVQIQTSDILKRLGGRLSEANEEYKDKPIDTGFQRLPAGIKNGIAKLQVMTFGQYKDDKFGAGMKGKDFFRAAAVVISPEAHGGVRTVGLQTSIIIPFCDVPEKGQRKASSFQENYGEFQNLIRSLGIAPCPETKKSDPTGAKTLSYYVGAMTTLVDPKRKPVYVSFSTRGWTPPASQQQPHPEEMVFETWHGLADFSAQHNPAGAVTDNGQAFEEPPQGVVDPRSQSSRATPVQASQLSVEELVEIATNDIDGDDGRAAIEQLTNLASSQGWTDEDIAEASNWEEVGRMAITPKERTEDNPEEGEESAVTVGSLWNFHKRDHKGNKLKNNKGEELPSMEVEVVTVDEDKRTCTVKSTETGRTLLDMRSKRATEVKFEWLE